MGGSPWGDPPRGSPAPPPGGSLQGYPRGPQDPPEEPLRVPRITGYGYSGGPDVAVTAWYRLAEGASRGAPHPPPTRPTSHSPSTTPPTLNTLRLLEQVAQIRSPASGLLCQNPSEIGQKVVNELS